MRDGFSARYRVWLNVDVDVGVLVLFSLPLIATMPATSETIPRRGRGSTNVRYSSSLNCVE